MTKCKDIQEWKIEDYRIVKSNCLGPVGPTYYPLTVYKNKNHLGDNGYQKDSCTITIQPENDLYLIFNICDNSLSQIKPDKREIEINNVDSIAMFSKEMRISKYLTKSQIGKFIKDWNNSKTSDYRDKNLDSIFFPTYQYKLTVHMKNEKREFLCFNFLINDRTKWTYYI